MNMRAYYPEDVWKIRKIWEKHFQEEFEFPDFLKGYYSALIIESNGEIILAGGVRPITELVCVTNKDTTERQRVTALKNLVQFGMFTCVGHGFDQLHCFVQGDNWKRQVETVSFRPTKGQALVLDV